VAVTHLFVSAKADGADATLVRPSNWNAAHVGTATPTAHAATHEADGSDPYFVAMQPAVSFTVPTNFGFVVVGPYLLGASVLMTLAGTARVVVL